MDCLLYFAGGMMFLSFCVPALKGLLSLFLMHLEKYKAQQAKIINSINLEIQDEMSKDPAHTQDIKIMGFIPEDDYDDEKEEDA